MTYEEFLASKARIDAPTGIADPGDLNPSLFDFQRDIVRWALRRGRAAIFADCGMGKTLMQLEWARHIPGRVIVAAPLAVAGQTVREASTFGIEGAKYLREDDGQTRIVVTNYEMLERFNPAAFTGIVLDESSILKSYTGKFRNHLVHEWGRLPFRLCATATPAPNDYMELGSHSEFIGAMRSSEMLSAFFINDQSCVGRYTIKGHAQQAFWRWLASWAVMIRRPSDLGYDDGDFVLPPLVYHEHVVNPSKAPEGLLFDLPAHTMKERQTARRSSVPDRVEKAAEIAMEDDGPCLVWCDRNDESAALTAAIPGAVEVKGSDSIEHKEWALNAFSSGDIQRLVSKPSIAGWGMNWQHCNRVVFTGLSDSFEQFYQSVRRCWRFGQKKTVHCNIVTAQTEGAVVRNIKRKERQAMELAEGMAKNMAHISRGEIIGNSGFVQKYEERSISIPAFLS